MITAQPAKRHLNGVSLVARHLYWLGNLNTGRFLHVLVRDQKLYHSVRNHIDFNVFSREQEVTTPQPGNILCYWCHLKVK